MQLKVCNIQEFSLHDGPGIRTTFFLSGCPLKCAWCHNPETRSNKPMLLFEKSKCINCKACSRCQNGAHIFDTEHKISRDKCTLCGMCVEACTYHALQFTVRELGDKEFFEIVNKQKRIAGDSGGITFSGGEPLMQGETILRLIENIDVHTAIETCGYAEESLFCRVVDKVDYVMFDLKLADDELHTKYTGVSNKLILKNLHNLRKSGTPYVLRTPLIPGITDTEENLEALSKIAGNDTWERLTYNTLAPAKYEKIGMKYPLEIK